jgi:hypothetical protein
MDVAVCQGERVEVVTSGLTRFEETAEKHLAGSGVAAKLKREKTFPRSLMSATMSIDVMSAHAKTPIDRQRFLNNIAGYAAESGEPPSDHPAYGEMNLRLRGLFALCFYHRAFARRTQGDMLLKNLTTAIRCDHQRESLPMCLAGAAVGDIESVDMMLTAIPSTLSVISLDFQHAGIADEELIRLLSGLPGTLAAVTLNLSGCHGVTDNGVGSFVKGLPTSLRSITFKGIERTAVTAGVQTLIKGSFKQFREWAKAKPARREAIIADVMGSIELTASQKGQIFERRIAMEHILELPSCRTSAEARAQALEILEACGGEWPKPSSEQE